MQDNIADPRAMQDSKSEYSVYLRVVQYSADQRVVPFQSDEQTKGHAMKCRPKDETISGIWYIAKWL